jgi:formylglycine-generating enzyme required for sulfatase activity
MGMTSEAASRFCEWLTLKTGRRYRLPTEAEWELACLAGSVDAYSFEDDAGALPAHAWYVENSDYTTHPVAKKEANGWGLFDMHGNVAEWVVDEAGKAVACGGSYQDEAAECTAGSRQRQTPLWNASDPQLPKSRWWLADCGFVGMRVVCEERQDR